MTRFAALLAATALLAVPSLASAQVGQARPNVVVIMTDDQTQASMRVMNETRRLLGGEGTTFERSFSTYPLCCPSRATYLTGQYSHNHRVIHNGGPYGGHVRLDHGNALPVWLQDAGYRTINVGRYLNGYGRDTAETDIPPGWSDWFATIDPSTFNYTSWRMNENGVVSDYPSVLRPGEHQTDFLARRATEQIDRAAVSPQPFFLSLTFPAPHSGRPRDSDDPAGLGTPSPAPRHRDVFAGMPLPRPPNFNEADVSDKPQVVSDRPRLGPDRIAAIEENYQQELESLLAVDEGVRSVYDALERSGELDNTLIVFTSDNGFMHGEHRWPSEKVLPYEATTRVPLVMRGPGLPRGRREKRLVGNIDVAATILDATDVPPRRRADGRSLIELVADPTQEWGRDILLENGQGANGVPSYRGIRTYRYLYVDHKSTGEEELYDLRRDRYQLRNLAYRPSYNSLRLTLKRRLGTLARCRGASCGARPKLSLAVRAPAPRRPRSKARQDRTCIGGPLRVRVRGRDARRLVRTDVLLGRRRVARDRRAPFLHEIPLRRLARGRDTRLRVRAETSGGRVLTLDRRVLRCP